jgi:hypothetical protein
VPDYRIFFAGPSVFKVEVTFPNRFIQVIGRFQSEEAARVWVADREARDTEAVRREEGGPLGKS